MKKNSHRLKDDFNCQKIHPQSSKKRDHSWTDHLLDRIKIIFSIPGRIRYRFHFEGDDILYDLIRKEVHKVSGAYLKSYSTFTRTTLVIYDEDLTSPLEITKALFRAVEEFALNHPDCEVGEEHLHQEHEESGKCEQGHDHSHNVSPTKIRKEIAKLALTGVLLGVIAYRRLRNQKASLPPSMEFLGLVLTIVSGYPIFKSGFKTLRPNKKFTDDTLISTAVFASLVAREALTGLSVVWLINLGRLLETITIHRSRNAIKDLLDVDLKMANLITPQGEVIQVPIEEIQKGMVLRIFNHERVPLDGTILHGRGSFQESFLTGESLPVIKGEGEFIYANSVLLDGEIDFEVVNTQQNTAVAKMLHSIEKMRHNKAEVELFGEKFASTFVPISLGTSVLVYLFTRDMKRAITSLVIACPCAAGLATPTAISAAIGSAARKGILIKGGTHLENCSKVDTILFDKTGTLTEGRPYLFATHFSQKAQEEGDEAKWIQYIASVEQNSRHPFAKTFLEKNHENQRKLLKIEKYKNHPGLGVEAKIDHVHFLVGNYHLMMEKKVHIPKELETFVSSDNFNANSSVFIATNGELKAIFLLKDRLRKEARSVIERLKEMGIKHFVIASGDKKRVVEEMVKELNSEEFNIEKFYFEQLPEDKERIVKELKSLGRTVMMVGDGVNDASAIITADISIALAASRCDLAIEAADITIAHEDLNLVAETIELSKKTFITIRQNFIFSVGVNGIGLLLGAGGNLNPLGAALVHNLSTITVVLNSFLLRKKLNYQLRGEKNGNEK